MKRGNYGARVRICSPRPWKSSALDCKLQRMDELRHVNRERGIGVYRLTRAFDYTIATKKSCPSDRSGRSGWQSTVHYSSGWLAQDEEIPAVVEELPGLPGPIPGASIHFGHYTKGSDRTDPGPDPDRTRPESRQHVLRVRKPSRARPPVQVVVSSIRGSGAAADGTTPVRAGARRPRTVRGTSYGGKTDDNNQLTPDSPRLRPSRRSQRAAGPRTAPPGQHMGDRCTSSAYGGSDAERSRS